MQWGKLSFSKDIFISNQLCKVLGFNKPTYYKDITKDITGLKAELQILFGTLKGNMHIHSKQWMLHQN